MPSSQAHLTAAVVCLAISLVAYGQPAPRYEKWVSTLARGGIGLITIDHQGRIYTAGRAFQDVPITANAFAPTTPSPLYPQGYVMQLDATGETVEYATYLIGLDPKRIAVDTVGFLYVLADHVEPQAFTAVVSFPAPITPNAAQPYPGLLAKTPVLLKIAPTGELVYSTYLGGLVAGVNGLAVDSRGAATVCGWTADPYLPVSANAYQQRLEDSDAFVTRISPDGSRFEAFTYLGGPGADVCMDVKIGASGAVYVYGDTNSPDFPVTQQSYQPTLRGARNLFVAEFDPAFTQLMWSTYIGSSWEDIAKSLTITENDGLVITGTTQSPDFPVSPGTTPSYVEPGTFDSYFHGLITRPFLAMLNPSGTQLLSSYVFPFQGGWLGVTDRGPFHGVVDGAAGAIRENATLNAAGLDELSQMRPQTIEHLVI